jgi:PleD family two-component response regulator
MNHGDQKNDKVVLVAVSDVFFYTKVRDALRPHGYVLERVRSQDEVAAKTAATQPAAIIINLNDATLAPFQALEQLKTDDRLKTIPILAFANHEEVETWKRAKELGVTKVVSRNEFSSRTRALVEEVIGHQFSAISSQPEAQR